MIHEKARRADAGPLSVKIPGYFFLAVFLAVVFFAVVFLPPILPAKCEPPSLESPASLGDLRPRLAPIAPAISHRRAGSYI
ncbi:MAG: hypothetical protein HY330_01695 [Chloroflexi bacterium]|nr:hypothetical protein [Chloroflexota bacterium]